MRPNGRCIMVFRTMDGKGIKGEIFENDNGERIFFSWRKSSEHKFRKLKAWGIDVTSLINIFSLMKENDLVIFDEDEEILSTDRKTLFFLLLSSEYAINCTTVICSTRIRPPLVIGQSGK